MARVRRGQCDVDLHLHCGKQLRPAHDTWGRQGATSPNAPFLHGIPGAVFCDEQAFCASQMSGGLAGWVALLAARGSVQGCPVRLSPGDPRPCCLGVGGTRGGPEHRELQAGPRARAAPSRARGAYLVHRSRRHKPLRAGQKYVGVRFPAPHCGVVAQDDVMKQAKELLVSAGLHLEGKGPGAGGHSHGHVVLPQMVDQLLGPWGLEGGTAFRVHPRALCQLGDPTPPCSGTVSSDTHRPSGGCRLSHIPPPSKTRSRGALRSCTPRNGWRCPLSAPAQRGDTGQSKRGEVPLASASRGAGLVLLCF